jgi:hypothetical protein
MAERKQLSGREFRELGLLQEVNRRLLHPIGLALEMTRARQGGERIVGGAGTAKWLSWLVDRAVAEGICTKEDVVDVRHMLEHNVTKIEAGEIWLSGVWDEREDPEGVYFGEGDKAERMQRVLSFKGLWQDRRAAREAALGYMVQPVEAL